MGAPGSQGEGAMFPIRQGFSTMARGAVLEGPLSPDTLHHAGPLPHIPCHHPPELYSFACHFLGKLRQCEEAVATAEIAPL